MILKKLFEHIVEGQIYVIRFDESARLLAAEIREPRQKQMQIMIVALQTGEILKVLTCDWWDSLVGITAHHIILQSYQSEATIPQVAGLKAMNWQDLSVNFDMEGFSYTRHSETQLQVSKLNVFNQTETLTLDLQGGQEMLFFEEKVSKNHLIFPRKYAEESPYFADLFQFLYRLLKIEAQKVVEYAEIKDWLIFSYYIYHGNQFENHLLIINRQQEILVHLLLNIADNIAFDTFVIAQNTLILTHHTNHLTGYDC